MFRRLNSNQHNTDTFRSRAFGPQRDPVDRLLDEACALKRSLSTSTDLAERNRNVSIMARAERLLCHDFARERDTPPLNGGSLAKIYLSLAYSRCTWTEFDAFFKIALLDSIHRHHITMSAKDAANTLWALAKIGCPTISSSSERYLDSDTINCLLQTIAQTSNSFVTQTCTNILWSFAMLDIRYSNIELVLTDVLRVIYTEVEKDPRLSQCNKKEIGQLKDFLDYYKNQFSPHIKENILRLTLCINQRAKEMTPPKSSLTHRNIEKLIKKLCPIPFKSEFSIASGFADICFDSDEYKIVFEVNGLTHYEKDGALDSHSRFRQRMMEKYGYRVFHINLLDWEAAHNKSEFIRGMLIAAELPTKSKSEQQMSSLTIFMPPETKSIVVETRPTQGFFVTAIPRPLDPPKERKRKYDSQEDYHASEEYSTAKYARKD